MSFDEEERFDPSKPFHPGPLKLEIKSIKNSTRMDGAVVDINSLIAEEESGRSLITAAVLLTWIAIWKFKAYISFFIVHSIDFIWTSIKNILGWGNEHYETTITLGHDHHHHGHKGHRHGLFNRHHHHHGHHHHEHHAHGWPAAGWDEHGWPAPAGWGEHGHHDDHHHGWKEHRWVPKNTWHHPATKLFEQPAIQYLPHGTKYTMLGFDQHQAYKYRRKYGKKFAHYRRKYFRKKGKQIIKAQRQRDKEMRKAEKRKKKAERRKEKWERFKERVKDAKKFYDSLQGKDHEEEGGGDDGDDEESHDDLKSEGNNEKVANRVEEGVATDLKLKNTKEDEEDDEEDDKVDVKDENKKGEDNEESPNDDLKNSSKNKDEEDDGDEDENDDLAHDDKSWEESSSEIEHGSPPRFSASSSYHHGQDYDPLPSGSNHQKFIRIKF